MAEYVLDHTIHGFIFEKEKKYHNDISHIMVTKSEINAINYINAKYMSTTRNMSYYIFGNIDQVKSKLETNKIKYPVLGAKLVISMFMCEATTINECEYYLRHLNNLMHEQGRMIICWCDAFGQSTHGFELLMQAANKCGLMINDLPYQVMNAKFTNFRMFVLNR
jgi:hypothetical protein